MNDTAFPKSIEFRGCKATIYRQTSLQVDRYEVRYFDVDGAKQRATFREYPAAKEFAEAAVREITQNRANFITLRGQEAADYANAIAALKPIGLTLQGAAKVLVEGQQLLAGQAHILEAIQYYLANRPRQSTDITVRQVADKLLDLKQRENSIGRLHLRDLRNRLKKFADDFQCPICSVQPAVIRDYILAQPVSERTQHNLRTTIASLFHFAAAEGYLPADFKGIPRPSKRRRMKMSISVFTPEEMGKLLEASSGDQRTALVLQGFAGIRAEEVKRLRWEHINFEEGHIVIPDSVAKCEERRLIPMAANLAAWLRPLYRNTGPVCSFSNLAIVYERMAHRAKIEWKRNGLRHSFISYRVAHTKNIPQVAFEAGNSPVMVQRHYLKVVTAKTADEWFNLAPLKGVENGQQKVVLPALVYNAPDLATIEADAQ